MATKPSDLRGAEQMSGFWSNLSGFLKGSTNGARLSIEEIGALTAQAGSDSGLRRA